VTHVLYIDRYHLGDPLFLNRLSRDLLDLEGGKVLVHGPGEDGERMIEAEGGITKWDQGMLTVGSDAERGIVERATRDLNRRIAHGLNDAGVPSVRIDGASRGLLHHQDDGTVGLGPVTWLRELVEQGGVPVVAALAPSEDGPMVQVHPGAVVGLLARALHEGRALFLARKDFGTEAALDSLSIDEFAEPEVLVAAAAAGAETLLVRPRGLRKEGVQAARVR